MTALNVVQCILAFVGFLQISIYGLRLKLVAQVCLLVDGLLLFCNRVGSLICQERFVFYFFIKRLHFWKCCIERSAYLICLGDSILVLLELNVGGLGVGVKTVAVLTLFQPLLQLFSFLLFPVSLPGSPQQVRRKNVEKALLTFETVKSLLTVCSCLQ